MRVEWLLNLFPRATPRWYLDATRLNSSARSQTERFRIVMTTTHTLDCTLRFIDDNLNLKLPSTKRSVRLNLRSRVYPAVSVKSRAECHLLELGSVDSTCKYVCPFANREK